MPKVTTTVKISAEAFEKFSEQIQALVDKKVGVKVGVFETAGIHDAKSGMSTTEIAAIHEFGSPAAGIPERSFLRHPIQGQRNKLEAIGKKALTAVFNDKMPIAKAMGIIGAFAVSVSKNAITQGEGILPALKPATIARKGSTRPLVDSGKLVNSITWQVTGCDESPSGGGPDGGGQEGAGGTDPAVEE